MNFIKLTGHVKNGRPGKKYLIRKILLPFLRKSLNLQESVKFIKEKLGEAIFEKLPFGARCTNLTQFFLTEALRSMTSFFRPYVISSRVLSRDSK